MRQYNTKNFQCIFQKCGHEAQQEPIKCCKVVIFIQQNNKFNYSYWMLYVGSNIHLLKNKPA